METRGNIRDELQGLSPLLFGMGKTNVFSVPDGYFQNLDQVVLAVAKDDESIGAKSFSREFSFQVPQGYFENLASDILNKIKTNDIENAADELRALSPMLYSIQNENVFEIPQGYFSDLAREVLDKTKTPQAKIINLTVTHKRKPVFKFAVAAMLVGVMLLGVLKYTNNRAQKVSVSQPIATLSPIIEEGKDMNDKQYNAALDSLSANDIANYLDNNSNESDVALLASNIDGNDLPAQAQYLPDANVLNQYLTTNGVTTNQ